MALKMCFGFLDQADNPGPPGCASILLFFLIYYSLSSFPLLNIKPNRTLSLPGKILVSLLGFQPSTVLSPQVPPCTSAVVSALPISSLVPVGNTIPTALFIWRIPMIDNTCCHFAHSSGCEARLKLPG